MISNCWPLRPSSVYTCQILTSAPRWRSLYHVPRLWCVKCTQKQLSSDLAQKKHCAPLVWGPLSHIIAQCLHRLPLLRVNKYLFLFWDYIDSLSFNDHTIFLSLINSTWTLLNIISAQPTDSATLLFSNRTNYSNSKLLVSRSEFLSPDHHLPTLSLACLSPHSLESLLVMSYLAEAGYIPQTQVLLLSLLYDSPQKQSAS